jgi:major type 1 subunit fimbrin (pilin)
MRVKKLILASAVAVLSAPALAVDGTITFNGLVTDQTCEITTPAGKDFTVTLPTVSASTLNAAAQTAGRTPFSINLSN